MTDIVDKNQANITKGVHVACMYDFLSIKWFNICSTNMQSLNKVLFTICLYYLIWKIMKINKYILKIENTFI